MVRSWNWIISDYPALPVGTVVEFIERPEKGYFLENFEYKFKQIFDYTRADLSAPHYFFTITKVL